MQSVEKSDWLGKDALKMIYFESFSYESVIMIHEGCCIHILHSYYSDDQVVG